MPNIAVQQAGAQEWPLDVKLVLSLALKPFHNLSFVQPGSKGMKKLMATAVALGLAGMAGN
ncbi:MAG: hypothetical protein ABIW30_02815, partial [Arenimonas sp.]